MTPVLLPWHEETFRHVHALAQAGRLPHAWLIAGPAGTGKRQLARFIAGALLCGAATPAGGCGRCHACQLMAAGHHPDLRELLPLDKSRAIRIDQVRDAVGFMNKTSNQGGRRVVILHPAESMNISSANALLKTLEEPPADVVILLVSDQPGLLPATVRSRCRLLKVAMPARGIALDWLSTRVQNHDAEHLLTIAEGAPLKALDFDDEDTHRLRERLLEALQALVDGSVAASEAAGQLYEQPGDAILDILSGFVRDLLRAGQGHRVALLDSALSPLQARIGTDIQGLHHFHARLLDCRRALVANSNPNPRLMLEGLFSAWITAVHGRHPGCAGESTPNILSS